MRAELPFTGLAELTFQYQSSSRPGPPSNQQHASQNDSRPPQGGFPPHNPYGQNFYPPAYGQFGPPGGFGGPPGPGFPGGMPYGAPPGWYPPPGQGFPPGPGNFPQQPPFGPPGGPQQRHPGPPGPGGPKQQAPTSEMPADEKPVSKNGTPAPKAAQPQNKAPQPAQPAAAPTTPVESKPTVAEALAPVPAAAPQSAPKQPPTGPKGRMVPAIPQVPLGKPAPAAAAAAARPTPAAAIDATRAATEAVAAAMAKLPQPGQPKKPEGGMEHLTQKLNNISVSQGNAAPRGTGRGGFRGRGRGGFPQQPTHKVEVPTTDFDFESANAKFNKQDLVKQAIASGSPLETPEAESAPNGSSNGVEKDEEPATDSTTPSAPAAYNRQASFFDNISSESKDREEGTLGRHGREWRGEEEKKNFETFGQGSVDGYRGGYRGRGRGRGFGRGRGGFHRGYGNGVPRGRGNMNGGAPRGPRAGESTGVPAST